MDAEGGLKSQAIQIITLLRGERGKPTTLVGHEREVDAGDVPQLLDRDAVIGARARHPDRELAGLRLGERDQLGERFAGTLSLTTMMPTLSPSHTTGARSLSRS
jgi:hypothetical protein